MNPLLVGGAAVGGLLLLERTGGIAALSPSGPTGTVYQQTYGSGARAACDYLRAHQPLAGATFSIVNDDPLTAYGAMRDALVAKNGTLRYEESWWQSASQNRYPQALTADQCRAICDAWVRAYDAGRAANSLDFSPFADPSLDANLVISAGVCQAGVTDAMRSELGNAVCRLIAWRDAVGDRFDAGTDIPETFDRVLRLASAMSGADVVAGEWIRKSDQTLAANLTGENVGDFAAYEASRAASAVASIGEKVGELATELAGSVVGGIAKAVASSPIVWAGALAYIGWRVLR